MNAIVKQLEQGLIVSCQALECEPLYGSHYMAAMALAAQAGGAKGIRANTAQDIKAIKKVCSLPVIGIVKRHCPGYDVYITPTMAEVCEVIEAGADIVAVDATIRPRPDGSSIKELLNRIRDRFQIPVMADVSNLEEGIEAARAGFDLVSTTLAGYTEHTRNGNMEPAFDLIQQLVAAVPTPIVAEGRIWRPEQCREALQRGAYAVVVGTAITRPHEITRRFVSAMQKVEPS